MVQLLLIMLSDSKWKLLLTNLHNVNTIIYCHNSMWLCNELYPCDFQSMYSIQSQYIGNNAVALPLSSDHTPITMQPSRIKCSHQNVDVSRFLMKNIYVKCALSTETMPLILAMTTSNCPLYFFLGSTVINFSVVLGLLAYMLVYTKYGALLVLIIFKC